MYLHSAREPTDIFPHRRNELVVEFLIRVDNDRSILARTIEVFVPQILFDSFCDACEWARDVAVPHNQLGAVGARPA